MNEPPAPPFNDAPPIPPPSGDVCPVCHTNLQGRPRLCPNCGAVLAQFSAGTSCWVSLLSITLSLLALAFGGVGTCFLIVVTSPGVGLDMGGTYVIIAFCLLAALGCGWAVRALNQRKK